MSALAAAVQAPHERPEADLLSGRHLEPLAQRLWRHEPALPKAALSDRAAGSAILLARWLVSELCGSTGTAPTSAWEEGGEDLWRRLYRNADELLAELGGYAVFERGPSPRWDWREFDEEPLARKYQDLPNAHRLAVQAEKLAYHWLRSGEQTLERLSRALGERPCLVRQQRPWAVTLSLCTPKTVFERLWGPEWRAARLSFAPLAAGGLCIERRGLQRPRRAPPEQSLFLCPLEPYLHRRCTTALTTLALEVPPGLLTEADPSNLPEALQTALEQGGFAALGRRAASELQGLCPDEALRLAGRYVRLRPPAAE